MDLNLTAGEFSCFFVMASCLGLSCQNRYRTILHDVEYAYVPLSTVGVPVAFWNVIAQAFSRDYVPGTSRKVHPYELSANQVSAGSDDE